MRQLGSEVAVASSAPGVVSSGRRAAPTQPTAPPPPPLEGVRAPQRRASAARLGSSQARGGPALPPAGAPTWPPPSGRARARPCTRWARRRAASTTLRRRRWTQSRPTARSRRASCASASRRPRPRSPSALTTRALAVRPPARSLDPPAHPQTRALHPTRLPRRRPTARTTVGRAGSRARHPLLLPGTDGGTGVKCSGCLRYDEAPRPGQPPGSAFAPYGSKFGVGDVVRRPLSRRPPAPATSRRARAPALACVSAGPSPLESPLGSPLGRRAGHRPRADSQTREPDTRPTRACLACRLRRQRHQTHPNEQHHQHPAPAADLSAGGCDAGPRHTHDPLRRQRRRPRPGLRAVRNGLHPV